MGVASWSLLSGPLYGSGPAGAAPHGRPDGRLCLVGLFLAGGVGCPVLGIRDTPALVGCCGCCGRGGRLVVGAPACVGVACCRGSGAVRPGCLTCLGLLVVGGCGWVWVGWL